MEPIDIKTELQHLIAKEKDIKILEAIRVLLKKSSLDPMLKEKLTSRAMASEENITKGDLFTKEEVDEELTKRLDL